jgi:hypothetical protein
MGRVSSIQHFGSLKVETRKAENPRPEILKQDDSAAALRYLRRRDKGSHLTIDDRLSSG